MACPRTSPAAGALALLVPLLLGGAMAGCTCKARAPTPAPQRVLGPAPGPGDPAVLELSVSQAMSGTWIKYRIDVAADGGAAVGRSTQPGYGPSDPASVPGTTLSPDERERLTTTLEESTWATLDDAKESVFDGVSYEVKIAWGGQRNAFRVYSGCACPKRPCPCPQLDVIRAIRKAVDPTLPDGGPLPMQDRYKP